MGIMLINITNQRNKERKESLMNKFGFFLGIILAGGFLWSFGIPTNFLSFEKASITNELENSYERDEVRKNIEKRGVGMSCSGYKYRIGCGLREQVDVSNCPHYLFGKKESMGEIITLYRMGKFIDKSEVNLIMQEQTKRIFMDPEIKPNKSCRLKEITISEERLDVSTTGFLTRLLTGEHYELGDIAIHYISFLFLEEDVTYQEMCGCVDPRDNEDVVLVKFYPVRDDPSKNSSLEKRLKGHMENIFPGKKERVSIHFKEGVSVEELLTLKSYNRRKLQDHIGKARATRVGVSQNKYLDS